MIFNYKDFFQFLKVYHQDLLSKIKQFNINLNFKYTWLYAAVCACAKRFVQCLGYKDNKVFKTPQW